MLSTYYLQGTGTLKTVGGSSNFLSKKNGGAGSGGVVKIDRLNTESSEFFSKDQVELKFFTNGGQSLKGDNPPGTIFSTKCPLGYVGPLCQACEVGTYEDESYVFYGTSDSEFQCKKCSNKADSSDYVLPDGQPWTNSTCRYECFASLSSVRTNPHCLNNFELFIESIGGPIIFILIIALTLGLILGFICCLFKKANENDEEKLVNDRAKIDKVFANSASLGKVEDLLLEKDLQFYDRDIYQHFSRINLIGNNSPFSHF